MLNSSTLMMVLLGGLIMPLVLPQRLTALELSAGYLGTLKPIRSYSSVNPPIGSPTPLLLNRSGELAWAMDRYLLGKWDDGETVMFFSRDRGFEQFETLRNEHFPSMEFGNWGAVARGYTPDGNLRIYAMGWGESPRIVFGSDDGFRININDDGLIAFHQRVGFSENNVTLWSPNGDLSTLPDLREQDLVGAPLIDNEGRILQTHRFGGVSDVFRYAPTTGWENLTANLRETGEFSFEAGFSRPNIHNDFLFETYTLSGNMVVAYFDATDQSLRRILSLPANASDSLANVFVSDPGHALFRINRGLSTKEYYLYDSEAGSVTPLDDFLDPGDTLHNEPYMNFRGDVVFMTTRSGMESGHLIRAGSAVAEDFAFRDLNVRTATSLVITDDLVPYFWQEVVRGEWTLTTVVPEPSAFGIAALGAVAVGYARRRLMR